MDDHYSHSRNHISPFTPFNHEYPSYEIVDRVDEFDDTKISIDDPHLIFGLALRTLGSTSWRVAPFAFLHEAARTKRNSPIEFIDYIETLVVARSQNHNEHWMDIDEGMYRANGEHEIHRAHMNGIRTEDSKQEQDLTFPHEGCRWTGYTKNVLDAVLEWIETRHKLGQTTDVGAIIDCTYPIYRGLVRRSIDELIGEKTLYCDENGILS